MVELRNLDPEVAVAVVEARPRRHLEGEGEAAVEVLEQQCQAQCQA